MSRIPRHVSSRVYVSHSETCKQPSVDLVHNYIGMRDSRWAVNELTPKPRNPEVLTVTQAMFKERESVSQSVSQSAISFHSSRLDILEFEISLIKSLMRLDCTCAFSIYFTKSEMWIVPIIKSINWNRGPRHVQLDFYRHTVD